jgi:hypothetical protein
MHIPSTINYLVQSFKDKGRQRFVLDTVRLRFDNGGITPLRLFKYINIDKLIKLIS